MTALYSNLQTKRKGFMTPAKSTGKVNTPSLVLDCLLNEKPLYSTSPTTNPIDKGASANDHVTQNPLKVQLEGIISNAALTLLNANKVTGNPAQDAFNFIEAAILARMPFDYIGGFKLWPMMVISEWAPEWNKDKANCLWFTMTLTQLNIVTSQVVLDTKVKQVGLAGGEQDAGSQTPADASGKGASDAGNNMSALKGLGYSLTKIATTVIQ